MTPRAAPSDMGRAERLEPVSLISGTSGGKSRNAAHRVERFSYLLGRLSRDRSEKNLIIPSYRTNLPRARLLPG
jgi:hypothetical protein